MPSPYKASRTLAVHACIAALVLCIGIGLTLAVVFVYRNAEHTKAVNQVDCPPSAGQLPDFPAALTVVQ